LVGLPRFVGAAPIQDGLNQKEMIMVRDVTKVIAVVLLFFAAAAHAEDPGDRRVADARGSELEAAGNDPRKKCTAQDANHDTQRRPKMDFRRLYDLNLTAAADHGRDQVVALV